MDSFFWATVNKLATKFFIFEKNGLKTSIKEVLRMLNFKIFKRKNGKKDQCYYYYHPITRLRKQVRTQCKTKNEVLYLVKELEKTFETKSSLVLSNYVQERLEG